jgi:signal transduction histidine kinase
MDQHNGDGVSEGVRGETLERLVLSYRRELSALRDIMSVAAESLELRVVLRRLLDHVLRMMKSKVGAIHLFDEQRTVLQLAASRGLRRGVLEVIDVIPGPFDLEEWPIEGSEPFVVREIAESLRQSRNESGERKDVAYVGVPVRSRGQVLGLISVMGRPGRAFEEGDVVLLRSIADQIGVVVENARLYRQAEQLAVLRERERLARELHDSVTQSLYSLTLLAEASQRLLASGDLERAGEYTARLGEIAQQALKEMRLLVYQLRPLVLKREGLAGALQQRLDAVEKRAGVDARLLVEGRLDLPASVEEGLYRIAQEALNNALKHAAPRSLVVRIQGYARHVALEVEDDGRGFDPGAANDQGGMGLTSMRERAERLGGTFSLISAPGDGTKVRVDVEVGG